MWWQKTTFYQFSTFGFCGILDENIKQNTYIEGSVTPENQVNLSANLLHHKSLSNNAFGTPPIDHLKSFIPHLQKLNIGAIYLTPIFYSDYHGYDTRDYQLVDPRLGSNADFARVVNDFHNANIKVVIDGVFNHVGRGFFAFQDVLNKKQDSIYTDWFYIDWEKDSYDKDGFWYEGWEGHFELVKLNLSNPSLIEYLKDSIKYWFDEFKIDGIRFDVAYSLPSEFLEIISSYIKQNFEDKFLLGEIIHGDYSRVLKYFDSCTNYFAYKGMWSSFNENNFFEINWTLNNEFSGTQAGTQSGFAGVGPGEEMYSELRALVSSGKLLYNFLDNHDLGRIASILVDKNKLRDLYQLLFFIPGIPQIYYGSEWGEEAEKLEGTDFNIRPYFPNPKWTDFTSFVSTLAYQHSNDPVMQYGLLEVNELTNTTYEIKRVWNGEERVLRIQL